MHQRHGAGHARRRGHGLLAVVEDVLGGLRIGVRDAPGERALLLDLHDGVATVGQRSGLGDLPRVVAAAAIARKVVPHDLETALRNRERNVVRLDLLRTAELLHQLGIQRALLRCIGEFLGNSHAAMGRIHRHLVAVRVTLEHGQLALGQLVLVLVDIVLGDDEQRLLGLERVAEEVVHHWRGTFLQATGPGRDAAIGIAGLFRTQRSQAGAKLGRFIRRYGSHHAGGQQGQCQGTGFQNRFHVLYLALTTVRSSRRS
ncbi:hypothetical protein D3C81_1395480 [compost metagenome]